MAVPPPGKMIAFAVKVIRGGNERLDRYQGEQLSP
jgi:hypothetical protein